MVIGEGSDNLGTAAAPSDLAAVSLGSLGFRVPNPPSVSMKASKGSQSLLTPFVVGGALTWGTTPGAVPSVFAFPPVICAVLFPFPPPLPPFSWWTVLVAALALSLAESLEGEPGSPSVAGETTFANKSFRDLVRAFAASCRGDGLQVVRRSRDSQQKLAHRVPTSPSCPQRSEYWLGRPGLAQAISPVAVVTAAAPRGTRTVWHASARTPPPASSRTPNCA